MLKTSVVEFLFSLVLKWKIGFTTLIGGSVKNVHGKIMTSTVRGVVVTGAMSGISKINSWPSYAILMIVVLNTWKRGACFSE
jgi:hypothetical protein